MVARGAAVAAGTAAVAATGWGWNQPYYGGGYHGGGWNTPGVGVPWDYGVYGPGGSYGASAYPGYYGRSYVTGRPTLFPRYYGGLGAGYGAYAAYGGVAAQPWDYDVYGPGGNYGASAYPGYGGYANRSYVTGRPTLFPRYHGW